jgi:hypothetical protein
LVSSVIASPEQILRFEQRLRKACDVYTLPRYAAGFGERCNLAGRVMGVLVCISEGD